MRIKIYPALLTLAIIPFQSCTSKSDDENMDEPVAEETSNEKKPDAPGTSEKEVSAEAKEPVKEVPTEVTEAPAKSPAPTEKSSSGLTNNVVYYIQAKSAPIFDQAQGKGKKVGAAMRGDHFLITTVENGWARTDDGRYIEAKNLSDKPLGRKKKGAVWK